jgi:hypothetical protein
MSNLVINFIPSNPTPSNGYQVSYRVKGSSDAYTVHPTNFTSSPATITGLPSNTGYEGFIRSECSPGYFSSGVAFSTCSCPEGYTWQENIELCTKDEFGTLHTFATDYCLAESQFPSYTATYTRIYTDLFVNEDVMLSNPPSSHVYQIMGEFNRPGGQWQSVSYNPPYTGPMNRAAVWVDSDCDGVKNALQQGAKTTIAYTYLSDSERKIYVGCGADNNFTLTVNNNIVADTISSNPSFSSIPFQIWHVIPITLVKGYNYFNITAQGDGSVNDSVAMVLYDNTAPEIFGATSDSQLRILFTTSSLRGSAINIANCDEGFNLDTSGGVGAYVCKRTISTTCI